MRGLLLLAAALTGCSAAEREAGNTPSPVTAGDTPAPAPERSLLGRWTIVAINGRAPAPALGGSQPGLSIGNLDIAIGPNRDMALFVGRFGAVRARMAR